MKARVNGFFRILDPLFSLAAFCGTIAMIISGLGMGAAVWETIGVTAIMVLGACLLLWFISPKIIQFVDNNAIMYKWSIRRPVRFSARPGAISAKYFVTDIYNLRIRQTNIEKFFNVGRVSFSGETTVKVKEKYQDRIRNVPTKHSFSGVQNFEEVKKRLLEMSKDIQL